MHPYNLKESSNLFRRETIYVHEQEWYADRGIDLRLGTRVVGIDPEAHEVALADGSRTGYAKLLFFVGNIQWELVRRASTDLFQQLCIRKSYFRPPAG